VKLKLRSDCRIRKLRDRSVRLSSSEILFEFMKDHQLEGRKGLGRECRYRERGVGNRRQFRDMYAPAWGRQRDLSRGFYDRVGYTRLSCRDGCSIMSTCSTCQPLRLNRSPDYPMTHNARPALSKPSDRTDYLYPPDFPPLVPPSVSWLQVCSTAKLLWPSEQFQTRKSNSRNPPHCYAITAGRQRKPSGIIILSGSR